MHGRGGSRIDWLAGGGELGALMRATDWSATGLGPPSRWPQSLKTAVRIMLTSQQPIWIGWGPELIYLYNDAYKSIIGGKHPWALGRPTSEVWREIWGDIGPMLDTAMQGVEGTYVEQQLLIMERNGYPEETYYTFSYSPIPDDDGSPGGIICANTEDTQQVIGERQLALLRELAARTTEARSWREACDRAGAALGVNAHDLPFALIYMAEPGSAELTLTASAGLAAGHPAAPPVLPLKGPAAWPAGSALAGHEMRIMEDLAARFDEALPTGAWSVAPGRAAVLPLTPSGEEGRFGVLVAGLNPYRLVDEGYSGFLRLAAGQIAASIAHADAYEAERRRAEALAELDRAKTDFFSNVSHEFRTPLTLLMGPVEQLLDRQGEIAEGDARDLLAIVHRNGLRLQRLVNTLLDFSRIEAGREEARFTPTDLSAFTAELAGSFRGAMEQAGLTLAIEAPPLPEPAYLDRDMWEKVVLNLLSNAFKFTLEGGVTVSVAAEAGQARVTVRDTGSGIPESELPKLFDRFHRVEGAKGRSFEGTGIGLALVHELVSAHGGEISVESRVGEGTAFTVALPLGKVHLPADRIDEATTEEVAPSDRARAFVEEARRWAPDPSEAETEGLPSQAPAQAGKRILLVDDNADMRGYVERLLREQGYEVETAVDGEAAAAAALRQPPDLVLSDVMMPRLDGFGLIQRLRGDARTQSTPVILLSARAGEEAKIEGLQAGADDYLTKPFSARELFARVESTIALATARRQIAELHKRQEQRQRFLLSLGDRLRTLSDPEEVKRVAAEMLGRRLAAGRCGYGEIDEGETVSTITTEWTDGQMPPLRGSHLLAPYGSARLAALRSGLTIRAADTSLDPLSAGRGEAFESVQARATLTVPLVKEGRLRACLFVHCAEPRPWSDDDVDLAQEVAERTWAAAEHARVEAQLASRNVDLEHAVGELRRSQEHQRLLINELNHRVKNTLATVQSIVAQSLRTAPSVEQARASFESRLLSLSIAHNILTTESWEGADLATLAQQTLSPFGSEAGRFRLQGPTVYLPPKSALAFAMALHELATNAVKYGALSVPHGGVEVSWTLTGTRTRPGISIVWRERDGPPVHRPARRGFGSRLIERGLANDLGGSALIDFPPEGVVCRIEAPLPTRLGDAFRPPPARAPMADLA